MIHWNKVLDNPLNVDIFRSFARGNLPKNDLLSILAYSDISPQIRNAVRERGTSRLRDAARRSLQRRELM